LIILEGKGRAFCAGSDIKDLYNIKINNTDNYIDLNDSSNINEYLYYSKMSKLKPLSISFMDGYVMGGGVVKFIIFIFF